MLDILEIEEATKAAADNRKNFESFVWFRDRELDDADNWSEIYTHNLDVTLAPKRGSHRDGTGHR